MTKNICLFYKILRTIDPLSLYYIPIYVYTYVVATIGEIVLFVKN